MGDTDGVTRTGRLLIQDWSNAMVRVERLKAELNRAETEALNAEVALSRWMLPRDAKKGEAISIWFGDSLLQVTADSCIGDNWEGPVKWRTRGPKLSEFLR